MEVSNEYKEKLEKLNKILSRNYLNIINSTINDEGGEKENIAISINSENPFAINAFTSKLEDLNLFKIIFTISKENENSFVVSFDTSYFVVFEYFIINLEFCYYRTDNSKVFDFKLGYSCNNNCRHCVVKPNIIRSQRTHNCEISIDGNYGMSFGKDLKFKEVVNTLRSKLGNYSSIVLTGGEPTIRKDFVNILKWLYYNQPHISVSLQTNGRNLSDINLVKNIKRYTRNIYFVVATHGTEDIHNFIVNNRKDFGNPYQETIKGIRNLQEVFKENLNIRTEIVLSKYNFFNIYQTIKEQYENLNIKEIGISYPHLADYDLRTVLETAPTMKELLPILDCINDYMYENEDLKIYLEEIPKCILNKLSKKSKFISMGTDKKNISVSFLEEFNSDITNAWMKDHAKTKKCDECAYCCSCHGVWKETKFLNEEFLEPISSKDGGDLKNV